eukprot:6484427-Amphidinium_carterae.1
MDVHSDADADEIPDLYDPTADPDSGPRGDTRCGVPTCIPGRERRNQARAIGIDEVPTAREKE